MIEVRELSRPPRDVAQTEEKDAERIEKFIKSRLKQIGPAKVADIEGKLSRWYKSWKDQTKPQRSRLVRYENILNGIVEESNFPFEGSSNITLHYAAGMARTFRATFNKTLYQDTDIFYPVFPPKAHQVAQPQQGQVEPVAPLNTAERSLLSEGFNHSFSSLSNGIRVLKEGTIPVVRDGTLVVSGRWRRSVERCFDQRTYRDAASFQKDYPDAKSAGVEEEKYNQLVDFFLSHSEDETPELIITFSYDFVKKNEPEYKVGPWAKFVRYPVYVRELDECEFHGYETSMSPSELKLKKKKNEIYDAGADKALAVRKSEGSDSWDKAVGFVEGLVPADKPEDRAIFYVDGVCMLDLDDDGVPEKYEVWFAPEEKALLKLTPYRLRRNVDSHVVFRLVNRENRLDGVSLIGDCEDLFNQIDILTRHRNNVRILTTSPIFMFNKQFKDDLDMGRAENVIRPGLVLWVDDPSKAGQQLRISDMSSTNDNLDEQNLYSRHVELVFGPTQGLSGGQTQGDPRAPASKTLALMNQANSRIDDYADEFCLSLPKLADLHAALIFQYSDGPTISFEKDGNQVEFPIEWLGRQGLRWGSKRRSVQLTPEFGLARLAQLQQSFTQLLPLIAAANPVAIELWNRTVLQSGEPQADALIMEGQTLQALQQSMQAMMAQNPKNPANQAKSDGNRTFHKEMAKQAAKHISSHVQGSGQPVNPAV